ncbi:MAG: PepSY domain-containing protein [Microbacterium sp.]
MSAQKKPLAALTIGAAALGLVLTGCASGGGDASDDDAAPSAAPSEQETTESAPDDGGSATERGADLATTEFAVSWEDALDTAQSGFDGQLAEIAFDWQRDRYAYTVELVSDSDEYEVRVDAESGETFDERTEAIESDDADETQREVVDVDAVVSWDDALATALDAQDGSVSEWKLEGTERGSQYQFDIETGSGDDAEVTIDAETGDLLETDD